MQLEDFHYDLPPDLIARYPLAKRSASRLLCLNKTDGAIIHSHVTNLAELLKPGDLLVFNNTKVMAARFQGHKTSGGKIEVLIERIINDKQFLAHIRASKTPRSGSILEINDEVKFEVLKKQENLYELFCHSKDSLLDIIEKYGTIPIPPYFQREAETIDKERYQTIYAQHQGSVAAPTAGLHFDEALFESIKQNKIDIAYLTLHVGAGTFSPVRVHDITQHQMHAEYIEVPEALCNQIKKTKASQGRVIAVGTTTARSLETASRNGEIKAFAGDTDIFIYPGFKFNCIDGLITNFHLPSSTLLMLVAAFAGHDKIRQAYEEAVNQRYRFFSYGDAMFIL